MRPKCNLREAPSNGKGRYARFSSTRQGRAQVFQAQQALLAPDSNGSHAMARNLLERTDEESRVDALLALLTHPDDTTRKWVVRQLGRNRELLDIGKIGFISSHFHRPEPELRITAAEALAFASRGKAAPMLLKFVKSEKNPSVVSRAIELLGELRREPAVKPELERMRMDPKYRLHWELIDIVLEKTLTDMLPPPDEIYLQTLKSALEKAKQKKAGKWRRVLKCSGMPSASEEYKKLIGQ